ncbi:MAG: contractile injection system tape measure protein [Candidatus Kapabacteria bacterium]|nr:contractile injection system tape measure protein [Candidatus Kapabacteria bacterium]
MHLIHTHSIDIRCSTREFGNELQQQLGYLLEKEFYPKLEQLFEIYERQNYTWNIDLLELNLPNISKMNWKSEIVNQSLFQIEEFLKNNRPYVQTIPDDNNITSGIFISDADYVSQLFFDFLKSGILVENSISNKLQNLLNEIEINPDFIKRLIENFEINPVLLIRWVFSVPDDFKEKVLNYISDFPVHISRIFEKMIKNSSALPYEIDLLYNQFINKSLMTSQWYELLQWIIYLYPKVTYKNELIDGFITLSEKYFYILPKDLNSLTQVIHSSRQIDKSEVPLVFGQFFQELKERISDDTNKFDNGKLTEDNFQNEFIEKSKDIYFITNSGLVIFHPFLEKLFEQLDLFKNDSLTKPDSQHKAILLTQYLITGKEEFYENELILNKILCGLPVESEVNTKLKITENEKEKCRSLIEAVLEHWKTMSGSSFEALRETFLQREGKLDLSSPYSYELWVEEHGVDILLAQLPWGIGMIKTPWMENYLTVNWN